MDHPISSIAPRRGRPRKFTEPSRSVTLTLPERIISALEAIDRDVSRAVVRLTQPELGKLAHAPAELVAFGRRAVILVSPTRTLEQRTGVLLVPLSDGRAIISFDESMTAARLELAIQDVLDEESLPAGDGLVFESIRDLLKEARRSNDVTVRQQSIMVLEMAGGEGRRRRAVPARASSRAPLPGKVESRQRHPRK